MITLNNTLHSFAQGRRVNQVMFDDALFSEVPGTRDLTRTDARRHREAMTYDAERSGYHRGKSELRMSPCTIIFYGVFLLGSCFHQRSESLLSCAISFLIALDVYTCRCVKLTDLGIDHMGTEKDSFIQNNSLLKRAINIIRKCCFTINKPIIDCSRPTK